MYSIAANLKALCKTALYYLDNPIDCKCVYLDLFPSMDLENTGSPRSIHSSGDGSPCSDRPSATGARVKFGRLVSLLSVDC